MKKLIFVRHGKAEDPESGITDFERSLTMRGKIISRQMVRKLKEIEKSEISIITSPAFRAIETALIFAGELGINPEKIIINSNIYYKMNLKYLNSILSGYEDNEKTIVMFGHNPSFTELADRLSADGCDMIQKSGVVCISFNVGSWDEIKHKTGKIEYFLKPENIL